MGQSIRCYSALHVIRVFGRHVQQSPPARWLRNAPLPPRVLILLIQPIECFTRRSKLRIG